MLRGITRLFLLLAMMLAPSLQQRMTSVMKGDLSIEEMAYYEITFINNWTAENHPTDYPSGSAHWSPPVAVSHAKRYHMFRKNRRSSEGVQTVAETGVTAPLLEVLTRLQSSERPSVMDIVEGEEIFGDEDTLDKNLMVTKRFRFISLISMVAPSPDWFVGFHNLAPFEDGKWYDSFTVVLHPYDAGTDSGNTYAAPDEPTTEKGGVFRITPINVPGSVFEGPEGKIKPLAFVEFKRVDGP